jgi:hypothetical protein
VLSVAAPALARSRELPVSSVFFAFCVYRQLELDPLFLVFLLQF